MINLGLNLFPLTTRERGDINLVIKVTDIADNRLVLHRRHMVEVDDIFVSCGGYKNICLICRVIHGDYAVPFHGGLKCADRIDLGNPDLC